MYDIYTCTLIYMHIDTIMHIDIIIMNNASTFRNESRTSSGTAGFVDLSLRTRKALTVLLEVFNSDLIHPKTSMQQSRRPVMVNCTTHGLVTQKPRVYELTVLAIQTWQTGKRLISVSHPARRKVTSQGSCTYQNLSVQIVCAKSLRRDLKHLPRSPWEALRSRNTGA